MVDFAEFRESMEKNMREFRAQMERDFLYELRELKKSNQFLSDGFDGQKNDLIALQNENKELKEANKMLLSKYDLEIKGISFSEEENIPDTLHQIGELIHEPIDKSEVEVCLRVPTRNADAPPNIVVQFKIRAKRNAVLEKAKKTRISTRDLGHTSGAPVFINKHLCPAMKQLLGMTVAQKKAKNWRFVWVNYGKILAKKDEPPPTLHIRSEQDVEKLCRRKPYIYCAAACEAGWLIHHVM